MAHTGRPFAATIMQDVYDAMEYTDKLSGSNPSGVELAEIEQYYAGVANAAYMVMKLIEHIKKAPLSQHVSNLPAVREITGTSTSAIVASAEAQIREINTLRAITQVAVASRDALQQHNVELRKYAEEMYSAHSALLARSIVETSARSPETDSSILCYNCPSIEYVTINDRADAKLYPCKLCYVKRGFYKDTFAFYIPGITIFCARFLNTNSNKAICRNINCPSPNRLEMRGDIMKIRCRTCSTLWRTATKMMYCPRA